MTDTIKATSITVTATASTSVPNGSPTRWATISAWCTAANTVAISTMPQAASTGLFNPNRTVAATQATAATGAAQVQAPAKVLLMPSAVAGELGLERLQLGFERGQVRAEVGRLQGPAQCPAARAELGA